MKATDWYVAKNMREDDEWRVTDGMGTTWVQDKSKMERYDLFDQLDKTAYAVEQNVRSGKCRLLKHDEYVYRVSFPDIAKAMMWADVLYEEDKKAMGLHWRRHSVAKWYWMLYDGAASQGVSLDRMGQRHYLVRVFGKSREVIGMGEKNARKEALRMWHEEIALIHAVDAKSQRTSPTHRAMRKALPSDIGL